VDIGFLGKTGKKVGGWSVCSFRKGVAWLHQTSLLRLWTRWKLMGQVSQVPVP